MTQLFDLNADIRLFFAKFFSLYIGMLPLPEFAALLLMNENIDPIKFHKLRYKKKLITSQSRTTDK